MRRYIYASLASGTWSDAALHALLDDARRRNQARQITGLLLYAGGAFLQLVEGPDGAVDALLTSLADDQRHTELVTVLDEPCDERLFPSWAMGFDAPGSADLVRDGFIPATSSLEAADLVRDPVIATALLQRYRQHG